MKKRFEKTREPNNWQDARDRIIGLGEHSVRKNYYPQLRARLNELERFRALLDCTLDMVMLLDVRDWSILDANASAEKLFGRHIIGSLIGDLMPERTVTLLRSHAQKDSPFEISLNLPNGSVCPMELSFQTVSLKDGTFGILFGRDIHIRKSYEQKLLHQANYDELTGLPNRALFCDRLSQSLLHAKRRGLRAGLLFIDLDRFKQVNDTLGHIAGDKLLREAAKRISSCVRSDDTVARLGGDEFTVIVPDITNPLSAELVAEKINGILNEPFQVEHRELFVSGSIGIALYPDDATKPRHLMQHADAAMFKAKELGRNRLCFFTAEMNKNAQERMQLEAGLRHALKRDQLELVYQPFVSLDDYKIYGAEVLLRWRHDQLDSIPPDKFIPIAEETGLIIDIGRWVLERSLTQAAQWILQDRPFHLSVNVANCQFKQPGFAKLIQQLIDSCRAENLELNLEITERLLMEDDPQIYKNLDAIKGLGTSLSIDDFGTGYSSLSYLKRFPISTLKIDRIFIQDVLTNSEDAALAAAIIAMAHSLGLHVVAEGIENPEQLAFLQQQHCDAGQGFYFSHPLTGVEFTRMLQRGGHWAAISDNRTGIPNGNNSNF